MRSDAKCYTLAANPNATVESWERGNKHGGKRRSSGGNSGPNHILERWALAGAPGRASQQKPTGSGRIPEALLPCRPGHGGQGEAGRKVLEGWGKVCRYHASMISLKNDIMLAELRWHN